MVKIIGVKEANVWILAVAINFNIGQQVPTNHRLARLGYYFHSSHIMQYTLIRPKCWNSYSLLTAFFQQQVAQAKTTPITIWTALITAARIRGHNNTTIVEWGLCMLKTQWHASPKDHCSSSGGATRTKRHQCSPILSSISWYFCVAYK